ACPQSTDRAPRGPGPAGADRRSVRVEALAGLAAELALGDQTLERRGGRPACVPERADERVLDRQRDVVAHDVEQLERAHGELGRLERLVDLVERAAAGLVEPDRVVEVRE